MAEKPSPSPTFLRGKVEHFVTQEDGRSLLVPLPLFGREAAKAPKSFACSPPPPQFNFAQFQTVLPHPPTHTTLSVFIHTQRPRIFSRPARTLFARTLLGQIKLLFYPPPPRPLLSDTDPPTPDISQIDR